MADIAPSGPVGTGESWVGRGARLGAPCKYCGSDEVYVVMKLETKPLGTFSLAGVGMKTSASRWPWAVCDGCGHESRGEVEGGGA